MRTMLEWPVLELLLLSLLLNVARLPMTVERAAVRWIRQGPHPTADPHRRIMQMSGEATARSYRSVTRTNPSLNGAVVVTTISMGLMISLEVLLLSMVASLYCRMPVSVLVQQGKKEKLLHDMKDQIHCRATE
jgi:hypothetical protein